ncbi:MAG: hypothetical protein ACK515_25930, partial [bacterium]
MVLSKDPTTVEPTTLADLRVVETIKEGSTIFQLSSTAASPAGRRRRAAASRLPGVGRLPIRRRARATRCRGHCRGSCPGPQHS